MKDQLVQKALELCLKDANILMETRMIEGKDFVFKLTHLDQAFIAKFEEMQKEIDELKESNRRLIPRVYGPGGER